MMKNSSLILSRRDMLGMIAAVIPAVAIAGHGSAAAVHPALVYMKQAAKDLLNAHRIGTVASFLRVIQRHSDVPQIALYSLGQYQPRLPEGLRERYYRGVAIFMSRYFADQSRQFPVAKYELGDVTTDGKDVLIDSRVHLLSGSTYKVVWRLTRKGKGYKIADAKVLGFSLVFLQRGIFTSYLSKRNGDIMQLVAALDR
jgi:phospholipid transport system substrate-binding protein